MENNHNDVRTWVEVDTKAIKNNYAEFRKLLKPSTKLMAVCKSNAYGHDIFQYAKFMIGLGADWLGVDSMTEALSLRGDGIKTPILVLGYTLPSMYDKAIKNKISVTISSHEQLESLKNFLDSARNDKKSKILNTNPLIHIKIDTGMHRQGFQLDEVKKVAELIKKRMPNVKLEGIFTHFAAAKNPAFPVTTHRQIEQFEEAIKVVESFGFEPIKHAAATGGTIVFPASHYDMVRIGIGLYGLWPSIETKEAFRDKINLQPALIWKTIISEIKSVKAGEGVGYDLTESLDRDGKIAILPIGYWHGYRRNLSSIGRVLVKNQPAKIIGRISMDMMAVDVSSIDCKVGDEVIVMGGMIFPEYLAALANTSWYEIITQINPLIRRVYI